jgi:hypothetical protein
MVNFNNFQTQGLRFLIVVSLLQACVCNNVVYCRNFHIFLRRYGCPWHCKVEDDRIRVLFLSKTLYYLIPLIDPKYFVIFFHDVLLICNIGKWLKQEQISCDVVFFEIFLKLSCKIHCNSSTWYYIAFVLF